ncbi:MAG TPA: hypothetical protein VER03_24330 [Bryobacteraceae bacterium]|nr:hypothetical protein [Bryobacteraceae bacterium]
MESQKSKRRAIKSGSTSSGDRRAGSVGERPELARSGGKDASEASTTPKARKRRDPTEAAEA